MAARPWSVYALVAVSLVALAWGQLVDVDRSLWDALAITIGLFLIWGLWTGRQWAFSISFILTSLCLVLAGGAALVQFFLFESAVVSGLLISAGVAAIWLVLLLRPETKRFAGLDRPSVPTA